MTETTQAMTRRAWKVPAAIVALGLALRLLAAGVTVASNDAAAFRDLHGDTPGYLVLGERLRHGLTYASGDTLWADRALRRPPGYPLLLASFDAILPGVDLWRDARPIVWAQAIPSTLAIVVTFIGVRRLTDRPLTASLAALFVALCPTSIAATAIAMPDGLHGSGFGAAFLSFAIVLLRPSRVVALAGGLALAAAVSLKPASMYWPAFALPMLLLARGVRLPVWLDGARLFAPTVLVVAIWTAENAALVGVTTYSNIAARNLRYDVVPRVEFYANKRRFPTRKEYEKAAEIVTTRDRKAMSSMDLATIDARLRRETSAVLRKHPSIAARVAVDNVLTGAMVRWQRSDWQFRGDGRMRASLRAIYEATGNVYGRAAWYAVVLFALPLALLRRDRRTIYIAIAATAAFGYVLLGITTIPSEGSRLLAGAEVPASLLAAITVTLVVDGVRSLVSRTRSK